MSPHAEPVIERQRGSELHSLCRRLTAFHQPEQLGAEIHQVSIMIAEKGQLQRQTPPPGLARKPEIETVGVFGLQNAVADSLVRERKKGREFETQAPTAAKARTAVAQLVAEPRPRRPDVVKAGTLV